jgi:uncharacterized protein (TIGR02246 family)
MSGPAPRLAVTWRLLEALNRRDVAAVAGFFAPNATVDRGDGTSLEGRDALAARLKAFFRDFPDAVLTSVQVAAVEPDAVVLDWLLEATQAGTGRSIRMVGADLFRFNAAGQIVRDDARIDTGSLAAQVAGTQVETHDPATIRALAARYTAAWNSRTPGNVAAFFSPTGSLKVNAGAPAVGREAIAGTAESFMSAFPDMELLMDDLLIRGDRAVYLWTFIGTNTGPGGTGKPVRFSGYEIWRFGADGLIAESLGHFDSGGYQRQLEGR